jgi:transcriptional regulator with XRE-family HTH domain
VIPISIRRKRLEAGLSQEQLALEIGVFQSTVSAWEQDKSKPQPKNLKKIAEACGCTVADLLREDG